MSDFFADFATRDPEWLAEAGPASDIALSTRARLARNLPTFPFPHQASPVELEIILGDLMRRLGCLPALGDGWDVGFATLRSVQRELMNRILTT